MSTPNPTIRPSLAPQVPPTRSGAQEPSDGSVGLPVGAGGVSAPAFEAVPPVELSQAMTSAAMGDGCVMPLNGESVFTAYDGDLIRAEALGLQRDLATTLGMLGHSDPFQRRDGMEQLLKYPQAMDVLHLLSQASSVQARRTAALCAIGLKRDPQPVLFRLMKDESAAVRYDVALAASRRTDCRNIILALQQDQDETVAEFVKRALQDPR